MGGRLPPLDRHPLTPHHFTGSATPIFPAWHREGPRLGRQSTTSGLNPHLLRHPRPQVRPQGCREQCPANMCCYCYLGEQRGSLFLKSSQ